MDEELKALTGALEKAQHDMGQVLEQAGPTMDFKKVTCVSGTDEEKTAAFRKINDDCAAIQKKLDARRLVLKAKEDYEKRQLIAKIAQPQQGEQKGERQERKGEMSLADAILKAAGVDPEHDGKLERVLKDFFAKDVEIQLGVSLKTLMETTVGWAPETLRTDRVVPKAMRPLSVLDLIPGGSTSQSAVVYMEETTLDESLVAEVSEGGSYGELAFALTERSETVRKIAAFLPVTDEQLEDVAQVRGYLNNRLPMALRRRLDSQLVNGSGVAPNLTGILEKAGTIAHSRSSTPADKDVDALFRAARKVRITGRASPNGIVINPEDFEGIRLMKTNDGAYIWGHPAEAGPDRIWGLSVAVTDVIAAGTAIVGDFMYCELAEKRGIVVKVSDSHSDYFIKGKQAIRADLRAAFPIYRAAAFCEVALD